LPRASKARTCLSYDEKRRLIADADAKKYPMQKSLAAAYGVSKAAVSAILKKQREKVEKTVTDGELEVGRKRTKRFKCEEVDDALVEWLHYADGKLTLSVATLLEQARRLAKQFGENEEEIDRNWVGLWGPAWRPFWLCRFFDSRSDTAS